MTIIPHALLTSIYIRPNRDFENPHPLSNCHMKLVSTLFNNHVIAIVKLFLILLTSKKWYNLDWVLLVVDASWTQTHRNCVIVWSYTQHKIELNLSTFNLYLPIHSRLESWNSLWQKQYKGESMGFFINEFLTIGQQWCKCELIWANVSYMVDLNLVQSIFAWHKHLYLSWKLNLALCVKFTIQFRFYTNYSVIIECYKNLFDVNLGLKCELRLKMWFNP